MTTTTRPAPVEGNELERLLDDGLIIDVLAGRLIAPEPPPVAGKPHLQRVIDAGVKIVNMTLAARADTFDDVLDQMTQYFYLFAARPDSTLHVKTVGDIHRAMTEKRLGVIFGTQTGTIVEKQIGRWTLLHQLGLRIAQICYNERSVFGDGCLEPENRGLTAYGRQAIQEMNRLGIVVDGSHTGERTTLDMMEYSTKPVIFSHANPRALSPSRRNITDEQMKAMAATGGVMGITPHSMLTFRETGVRPTLTDVLDMVDYAVQLLGIDHVGIGTDLMEQFTKLTWESTTKLMYPNPFFYETMWAEGFNTVSDFPNAIRGLLDRGYRDSDLEKILGLNWLRVFEDVWDPGATVDPSVVARRDTRLWS